MRFGELIGLLVEALALSMEGAARAEVIITYPTNGATVNGAITVTAQINSSWWSKLWVDGQGIAVAGIGNVSFTWNTSRLGIKTSSGSLIQNQKTNQAQDYVIVENCSVPRAAPWRLSGRRYRSLR
jgi:hypothetical protein